MSDELTTQTETAGAEHVNPKGEYKMLALLFAICLALFIDSLRSPGLFQGVSNGPGSIPQLVSGCLLLMIVFLAFQLVRKNYKEGSLKDVARHLFDREVVILLCTLSVYGLIVETIHFLPATFLFLVATMYLLDRKQLLQKAAISAGTLAVLYLIFSTLFQVVLP